MNNFECPRCGHCCYVYDDTSQERVDETAKNRLDREDIIRMAREAEFEVYETDVWITDGWWTEELERFAVLVAAAECEAVIAIVNDNSDSDGLCCTDDLLAAIRARGNK